MDRIFVKRQSFFRLAEAFEREAEIEGRARILGIQFTRLAQARLGRGQIVAEVRFEPIEELRILGARIDRERVFETLPGHIKLPGGHAQLGFQGQRRDEFGIEPEGFIDRRNGFRQLFRDEERLAFS